MRIFNHPKDQRMKLQKEAQQWLLRLTSGAATTDDADAFAYWCALSRAHPEAFAESRRLWENLGPASLAMAAHAQEHGVPKVDPRVDAKVDAIAAAASLEARRRSRRAFLGGAVAASAALLLLPPARRLWPSLSALSADYRTATGEQRQVEVAPGIIIEMNTQTNVNVRSLRGRPIGVDLLSGELQLSAAAQAQGQFTVFAAGGSSSVGAQGKCNVRFLGAKVQITGLDGPTALNYAGRHVTLGAAQRIDYAGGELSPTVAADTELTMAWRRRILVFDGQPLSAVVEEINRYRPGKIIVVGRRLAARRVQARLSLNQLSDVANLIHEAYGATVTFLPDGIVVIS